MTNDIKPTINPLVHSHSLIPNHLHDDTVQALGIDHTQTPVRSGL